MITVTADEGFGAKVYVNDVPHTNGTAYTWKTGLNRVRVVLTLADETITPEIEYKVDVTKSGSLGTLTVASVAGTAEGDTAISVTEALSAGLTYRYATGASVALPALDADLTAWTAWDGSADITATNGHDIVVAETLAIEGVHYAKKAGKTTVVANTGT